MSLRKTVKTKGHINNTRYQLVRDILDSHKPTSIAEIGCSDGTFAYMFARLGIETFAIDVDCSGVLKRHRHRLITYLEGRAEDLLPCIRKVEAIHLGEVLEHVKDPVVLMRKSMERLVNKGLCIVSVPNFGHPTHRRKYSMASATKLCRSFLELVGKAKLKHQHVKRGSRMFVLWGRKR